MGYLHSFLYFCLALSQKGRMQKHKIVKHNKDKAKNNNNNENGLRIQCERQKG